MNPKKHLSFGSLLNGFSKILPEIGDRRVQGKINYSIHDTIMAGLACMVFQDPSLLDFQRRLEDDQQRNNLQTLFKVKQIPGDSPANL